MIWVRLTREAIDPAGLVRLVASESCGAVTLFLGTVRDTNEGRGVTGIEYSAYEAMAGRELREIADETSARFGVQRLAIEHRLGELALGEVSVAIAVAHEHRAPALDAERHVIEELKRRVPIWKREQYVDGTREWVDPSRPHAEAHP